MYIRVPTGGLEPRHYQRDFLSAILQGKNVCSVIHRRAGKDTISLQAILLRALTRVGTHIYLAPLLTQIRQIIWQGMTHEGFPFINYIPEQLIEKKNEARMEIQLINGSVIKFAGSNNFNGLMGTNPVTIIYSEYSLHNPLARQYLNPILIENGGLEICQFTPRGMNHGWELLQQVEFNENYLVQVLGVDQTFKNDGSHVVSKEKIIEARKIMSEEMVRQEFFCFPFDSLVITDKGLKPIGEIKKNNIVLSHAGRFRNVDGVIQRHYKGDMIRIKSTGSPDDIVCTPEHPIRIYDKKSSTHAWIKAEDIQKGDYLCFPKLSNSKSFPVISEDIVKLLAWFTTEGSTSKGAVQFTLGAYEKKYQDAIIQAIKNLGFKPVINIYDITCVIHFSSAKAVDFFVSSCGAVSESKRIPLELISGYEELYFNTLVEGDGCVFKDKRSKKNTVQLTTISKTLAYQFQLLGNTVGYRMTITKCKMYPDSEINGRKIKKLHQKYDIRGTKPNTYEQKQNTKLRKTKYGIASYVNSVSKEKFEGTVYNLNVSKDHTYTVNGRTVHNCDFEVGNQGAYFTREMTDMKNDGRATTVSPIPGLPLHTCWDLGGTDSTAALLFQVDGRYINILAVIHDHGYGLKHYLKKAEMIRQSLQLPWGQHYMPHDIKQGHQGWENTESRLMKARREGWSFIITPKVNVEDGIEAMRFILPYTRINMPSCDIFMRALREYQREYDETRQKFKQSPLENWSVHLADAFRYLAVNYRRLYTVPQGPSTYSAGV